MAESVAERYLRLALQLNRLADGVVDAYFGPAEIAAEVAASPLPEPAGLARAAEELLADIGDGWLCDQVAGLRTYAAALSGASMPYADEVEGCFGIRPTHTDEAVFADAHAQLEALLPGRGTLADRYQAWEASMRVPVERIEGTVAAIAALARAWTREIVELPEGESVTVAIVRDVPWLAYCTYEGQLRSTIEVNVSLPMSAIDLLITVLHETYPGHQAERACKEQRLVREQNRLEETIVVTPTPQSLITEGIGKLAPELLLADARAAELAGVVADAGVALDLPHAVAVRQALEPCAWAEVNAALDLHVGGRPADDVAAYLQRWELLSPELAAHVIRFATEPASRTYLISYPAGRELCRTFVGSDLGRFRRLLTEQVRVGDLLAACRDQHPSQPVPTGPDGS